MSCDCKNILNLQPICNPIINVTEKCNPTVNITDNSQGTLYHDRLSHRDNPDQHPIGAITGLDGALEQLSEDIVSEKERATAAEEDLSERIDQINIGDIVGGSNIEVVEEDRVFTINSTTTIFEQGIASATWTINHNLNKHPSIQLVDSSGRVFEADKEYTSNNQVIIHLQSATTGFAYLN